MFTSGHSRRKGRKVNRWFMVVKAANKTKWPDKPKRIVFQQIHKFSKSQSRCTYVLQHEDSVAASSLRKEDLLRFGHRDVSNNAMFVGCLLDPVNERKCIQLKEALKSTLRFMLVWSHIRIDNRSVRRLKRGSWKIRKAKIYVKGSLYN